jgi:hypothetical protein
MKKFFGGVLLSHTASRAVPSALKSLTSVFGMGTGVASSPSPPKNRFCKRTAQFGMSNYVLIIYVSYFVAKPHD